MCIKRACAQLRMTLNVIVRKGYGARDFQLDFLSTTSQEKAYASIGCLGGFFLFVAKECILEQFNKIFGRINNPIKINSDH